MFQVAQNVCSVGVDIHGLYDLILLYQDRPHAGKRTTGEDAETPNVSEVEVVATLQRLQ
jgi:hypothetical protein